MIWYVYILECSDGTLYTGATNDLNKRVNKHNNGTGAKYIRGRTPVLLKWSYEAGTKSDAYKLEYKIKQMSRVQKLKIISDGLTNV